MKYSTSASKNGGTACGVPIDHRLREDGAMMGERQRHTSWRALFLLIGLLLILVTVAPSWTEVRYKFVGRQAQATLTDVRWWTNRGGVQKYALKYRFDDDAGRRREGTLATRWDDHFVGEKCSIIYLDDRSRPAGETQSFWLGLFVIGVGLTISAFIGEAVAARRDSTSSISRK